MTQTTTTASLDWLMDNLVDRVPGARHAVLLSADGLLIAQCRGLPRADAEHLAAVGSAFGSLSRGVGHHFALGAARQTVVELADAYLLITDAGTRAGLVLVAEEYADLGLVAYEVNRAVLQAGPHLSTQARYAS